MMPYEVPIMCHLLNRSYIPIERTTDGITIGKRNRESIIFLPLNLSRTISKATDVPRNVEIPATTNAILMLRSVASIHEVLEKYALYHWVEKFVNDKER
jgi:hypothetical protein